MKSCHQDLLRPLVALALLALFGCRPSEPRLSRTGVDAPGAVELLERAKTPSERDRALSLIETERRIGFDWPFFWRAMPTRIGALPPEERPRALALARLSCAEDGFAAFARFALETQSGLELAIGEGRACELPLPDDVRASFMNLFTARAFAANPDPRYLKLLSDLIAGPPGRTSHWIRTASLNSLSINRWNLLTSRLLDAGEGSRAARIVELHRDRAGDSRVFAAIALRWLERPEALAEALKRNRTSDVARILTTDERLSRLSADLSTEKWSAALGALSVAFVAENATGEFSREDFERQLRALHALELLPTRARRAPDFEFQLAWHERLLRSFEDAVKRSPDGTGWLEESDSDTAIQWLKIRSGSGDQAYSPPVAEGVASTPLELAVAKRIEIRALADDQTARGRIAEYCAWLESKGVASRSTRGLQFDWRETTRPGCIRLTGISLQENSIARRSVEPIEMAFDSVLISNGWNLSLEAPRFDGSFIDLSTELRWRNLPAEPAPENDSAIAFPVLLGFRTTEPFLGSAGIHYFPYHFTWRFPSKGLPARAVPREGHPGGDLEIVVREPNGYFAPRAVSFGGDAQTPVPRRRGGAQSSSAVDWSRVATEFARLRSTEDDRAPYIISSPSVRVLRDLLAVSESDASGATRVFIDAQNLWNLLGPDQRAKALLACPNGPTDNACWASLARDAARQLYSWYSQLCSAVPSGPDECRSDALTVIGPRLNSSAPFIEPEGELGPENPIAARGRNGRIEIKVEP